jgi:RNA polymerase primary sigma factor
MAKTDLEYYFKELSKIPVLEQQITNKLAIKARNCQIARDQLVKGNLRYVIAVAKNFYGQGVSMSDLIAEGNVGLITAVSKFKPEKDENFMKCAGWWIRHSIMYAISNNKVIRKPMNKVQEYKEENVVYEREKLTETLKMVQL